MQCRTDTAGGRSGLEMPQRTSLGGDSTFLIAGSGSGTRGYKYFSAMLAVIAGEPEQCLSSQNG